MRGEAKRVGHRAQMRMQNFFTGSKFTKFLIRRRGIISGFNACIYVVIFPFIVECQCTEWTIYANFRPFAPKSVTMKTYIERSRNEGQIDHADPYTYFNYPKQLV